MKLKPLTSLRFFFALMVFCRHTDFIFNHEQFKSTHNPALTDIYNRFFAEGYVGVSFFFMLSGFILSLNYKDKIAQGSISFREFWVARIARVYPLHLFTLLIAIPVSLSGFVTAKAFWLGKFLLNVLLLQSFVPDNEVYFAFNGASWSISDELFFYLLFPVIITAYLKYGKSFKLAMVLLPVLIPLGIYWAPAAGSHHFFYINPVFRIVDFLIGILLYQLYEKLKSATVFRNVWSATAAEIIAVACFGVFFAFHLSVGQGYRYSCYYWLPVMLVIFVFAYQGGYLSKLISGRWLVLAGEISFSFYLLHQLVMKYVAFFNAKFFIIHSEYLLVAIIFGVSALASYCCYRFIEIPCNRFIKAKYQALRSPALKLTIPSLQPSPLPPAVS